jgi:hypothetical protein
VILVVPDGFTVVVLSYLHRERKPLER